VTTEVSAAKPVVTLRVNRTEFSSSGGHVHLTGEVPSHSTCVLSSKPRIGAIPKVACDAGHFSTSVVVPKNSGAKARTYLLSVIVRRKPRIIGHIAVSVTVLARHASPSSASSSTGSRSLLMGSSIVGRDGQISFAAKGFKPHSEASELLVGGSVTAENVLDGVEELVLGTSSASSTGVIRGSVALPSGTPAGQTTFEVAGIGSDGSSAVDSAAIVIDLAPPTVISVSAQPSTVSPGDMITLSSEVEDPAGVKAVELQSQLVGSSGVWAFCDSYATLTSGTNEDGIWSISCTVPTEVLNGNYTVVPFAEDVGGNWTNTNGGPATSVQGSFVVTGGLGNAPPPSVLSINTSAATVSPGDTLVVSADVTSPVGVKAIELQSQLVGSSGVWAFCDSYASLSSGTAEDGTWSITCPVPAEVLSGTYTIVPFAEDVLGQWTNTNGGPATSVRGSFSVTGGLTNIAPPTVVSVETSSSTVSPGDSFTVNAEVTSPVGVSAVELQSQPAASPGSTSFCDSYADLTSGSNTNGVWSITCTVPATVVLGEYTVVPFAEDVLGQWVNSNGGPTTSVTGSFTVAG